MSKIDRIRAKRREPPLPEFLVGLGWTIERDGNNHKLWVLGPKYILTNGKQMRLSFNKFDRTFRDKMAYIDRGTIVRFTEWEI